MGLLTVGTPLTWEETKKFAQKIKEDGITQFINLYKKVKDRKNDQLFWGDEIEYTLIKFDHINKKVSVLLKANAVIEKMKAKDSLSRNTVWQHEYASYAIEGVPGSPYGHLMGHFNTVESNMQLRRNEIKKDCLEEDETLLTITCFPRIGCPDFTFPRAPTKPKTSVSGSLFFPDEAIQREHPRFKTLTRNIRARRGKKVEIHMPIFRDKKTPNPFVEDLSKYGDDGTDQKVAKPNFVYMDAMGFGMGMGCLQTTFQACGIDEARVLYDQLTTLCPILMALSASSPIMRGFLLDTDCRWDALAASVDDRTAAEMGLEDSDKSHFRIPKSRFDSVDAYLSASAEDYNDTELVYDEPSYQRLCDNGVDCLLARHIAHLFIRDPISAFSERIEVDNETDTDHFENIQSTNWQSMRFKPPPPNSSIGWRVEFRPMDLQLTDFENAAYVSFVVLVTRVILTMKLNLLVPISRVQGNMRTAMRRDAVLSETFAFRKGEFITTCSTPLETTMVCDRKRSCSESMERYVQPEDCFTSMTADQIINGGPDFPGLIPLIKQYLRMIDADVDTMCTISQYLQLISRRASGKLPTTASWMRQFVQKHPHYRQDSVVSESVCYDLLQEISLVGQGHALVGPFKTRTNAELPQATLINEAFFETWRAQANMTTVANSTGVHDNGKDTAAVLVATIEAPP